MKTFIRVTEIWVPSQAGDVLEFGGGLYGDLDEFKGASQGRRFARDEGLPGKAWASRHPIILKDLSTSYFLRAVAAAAAGLTCGVALPVFAGDALKAVVVFLCGSDEEHVGAIEVWKHDPAKAAQIGQVDGYYGTAELFEWTSRHIAYGKGSGLPGIVWQAGMPVIIDELYRPGQFLRSEQALQVGLNTGIGLPILHDHPQTWVMTFLSARGTPIARRFEIWAPDDTGKGVALLSGSCGQNARLLESYKDLRIKAGDGLIGRTLATGTPSVMETAIEGPALVKHSLGAAGLTQGVALPVFARDGACKAVVAWYF